MAIATRSAAVSESASTLTQTASLPAGTANGDVVVAYAAASAFPANITWSTTGWTEVRSPLQTTATAGRTIAVYMCVYSGQALPSFTMSVADRATWLTASYTGVDTTTPQDTTMASSTAHVSGGSIPTPSITTVTNNAMLVAMVFQDSSSVTWTAPSGMTLEANHTTAVGRSAALADQIIATAGATGTKSFTSSNTTNLSGAGVQMALRPSTAAAPTTITFPTVSAAGWTVTGTDAQSALSDALDSTYITSSVSPAGQTVDLTLAPIETPTGNLVVTVRAASLGGATSASLVGTLRDGATTVATAATVNPTSTTGDLAVTFTSASISSVTQAKWRAGTLVVRLAATAT